MPTYDYQCRSCGAITEVIHSMLEDGPTTCERCGGDLRRVLYPTGIIFKGPGFYSTDSRNGSSRSLPGSSGSGDSASSPASSATSGSSSGSGASSGSGSGSGSSSSEASGPSTSKASDASNS